MSNMDWMYKRPTIDTEAYLLGKPVDKSLELLENPDGCPTSNEDIGEKPGALFLEAAASAALEAEAKVREDPLFFIKKREEQQRRQLLNNPIRLKKLQEEVERRQQLDQKKEKASKEKMLLSKMLKLKSKYGTDLKDILSASLDSDDKSSKSDNRRPASYSSRNEHHHRGSSHYDRSSPKSNLRHGDSRSSHRSQVNGSRRRSKERKHSTSRDRQEERRRSRSRSVSPRQSKTTSSRTEGRLATQSSRLQNERQPHRISSKVTSKKFDPEELERRRLEMMRNAKDRDEQRAKNVSEYRQKEAAEEAKNKEIAGGGSGGFLRPLLADAAATGTLEGRIKSNRHNLQRTRAALDQNFTRR